VGVVLFVDQGRLEQFRQASYSCLLTPPMKGSSQRVEGQKDGMITRGVL